jgi:hypothetical protein
MRPRVFIWTIGLAIVGYSLAGRSNMAHPTAEAIGALVGGVIGFGVGWGLQRLLELGRRR